MRTAGFILMCGVLVAVGASAALAQIPQQDGVEAFRAPAGTLASAPSGGVDQPMRDSGTPAALASGAAKTVQITDPALLAANEVPPLQVAQMGTPGAAPVGTPARNPWVFGTTLYGWLPFASGDATIGDPATGHIGWRPHTETHTTNLFGLAAEFTVSKGDWGAFGNLYGGYMGIKGEILREDPLHPNHPDRSGYSHSSFISGEYGLAYRILGQPLDLAAWARKAQPVAIDFRAGAQTTYVSQTFSTQREFLSANRTLTTPLVGALLSWDISDRWNLGVIGSVGGFGVDDMNLTWQANLTIGYRFRMGDLPGAVTLGFRGQGMQLETGKSNAYFKLNERLYGPLLGFSVFF